jgi:hypothetical protein
MPTWRTELPPEGKNHGYDLRRTPTHGNLIGIISSDHLLVCDTHYWHGRTTPCERECNAEGKTIDDSHCPACLEKAAWRTHVYVSVFDLRKREHFIFECTTNAAKTLQEYHDATGTLRGCILNACRPKQTPNAKVSILTNPADLSKCSLPQAPNIADALAIIWRLPSTAIEKHPMKYSPTELRTNAKRLRAMRTQPDNACDPPTIGDIVNGNGQALHTTVTK